MRPVEKMRDEARPDQPRVLFLGFSDTRGGAAIASARLIRQFADEGTIAPLEIVSLQQADEPWTLSLNGAFRMKLWRRARDLCAIRNEIVSDPYGWLPLERWWIKRVLESWQPDIIHMHNIHGGRGTIPPRAITMLSRYAPIVWTLHDMWPVTGHCAYSMACEGWREACPRCPDLTLYPHIRIDRSGQIAQEKQAIFGKARPVMATPSAWLRDVVEQAPVTSGLETRVIPNGIDLDQFNPALRAGARAEMGLDDDTPVLMFAAENLSGDPRKGAKELHDALEHAARLRDGKPLHVILMGDEAGSMLRGIPGLVIDRAGFVSDPAEAARLYAAADLFVCPSLQDNLPNTLLEASACATASIMFDAGGSKETVDEGVTGIVVPFADSAALGSAIASLLDDPARLRAMGAAARIRAERLYSASRMASDYLALYRELMERRAET